MKKIFSIFLNYTHRIIGILLIILMIVLFTITNNRTVRLRKNPKVGQRIMYYVWIYRFYVTITHVFKNHVRIECEGYKQFMENIDKNQKYPSLCIYKRWVNVSKNEIYLAK